MSAPPCPACALKDHQLALLTHALNRQTEACSAISARLAERDHWIAERIAGERRAAATQPEEYSWCPNCKADDCECVPAPEAPNV